MISVVFRLDSLLDIFILFIIILIGVSFSLKFILHASCYKQGDNERVNDTMYRLVSEGRILLGTKIMLPLPFAIRDCSNRDKALIEFFLLLGYFLIILLTILWQFRTQ